MLEKLKQKFDVENTYLKDYKKLAHEIVENESKYSDLAEEDFPKKTKEFMDKIAEGTNPRDLIVDTFALAREAAKRSLGQTPFEVQVMGAISLYDGNIAEMKTGEGKTLTATMAVYLMALENRGVHVVTVNEYLSERDAEEMGVIYRYLGLTVGLNKRESSNTEKREAYAADILYTTNSELGFDYLRDNMAISKEQRVQRGLRYVIVDEVDSILIDESRTPLIISGQPESFLPIYNQVDAVVKILKEDEDYRINLKDKVAHLLPKGIDKLEQTLARGNLFDLENSDLLHATNQSLKANYCMFKDIDYVVKEGKVVIVDQFTGRLMEGRTYSDGLHQALEAKEHVKTQERTKTLATITYQNFFRLYDQISGMTGTAKTEQEEFQKTYGMDVITIPTNKPIIRLDNDDMIFAEKKAKYEHMAKLIKERHQAGQPILIGTVAIESSEEIAKYLRKAGLKFSLLNAKNHAQEAEIIAKAGERGSITIATNMAGRGTDIKLAPEVKELEKFDSDLEEKEVNPSGLLVIGTERHESRRIDNQLRGRSGRQGDYGESFFYISFEDDLLKRYSPDRTKTLLSRFSPEEAITSKMLSRQIEGSQRQVEGLHYDARRNLLKYDDVLREQREAIYYQRDYILDSETLKEDIEKMISEYIQGQVDYYTTNEEKEQLNEIAKLIFTNDAVKLDLEGNLVEQLQEIADREIERKVEALGNEVFDEFANAVIIKVFDTAWVSHIDEMQTLRQTIGLRGYGQVDPLHEYQREGKVMYEEMISSIEEEITKYILKGNVFTEEQNNLARRKLIDQHDQATHTYTNEELEVEREREEKKSKTPKVGRNEKCPCGSGKKYKDCHGR